MRLIIVSNRLAATASAQDGKFTFQNSPGGLASGLSTYLQSFRTNTRLFSEYLWLGWPGSTVNQEDQVELRKTMFSKCHSYPVFLTEEQMDNFYHGFCNKTIWALFHYFLANAIYKEDFWLHYKAVNEVFCEAVEKIVQPGDVVWIQDYHLMLLPQLLRERIPQATIGFFLHIPFPSFEVFRHLPSVWRSEILDGLLGADLIGFHTHDYVQSFLHCALRILGHEHSMGEILLKERIVKVDTFPMGIDFRRFHEAPENGEVKSRFEELKNNLGDSRVILSMDRLDYSKGIAQRLRGYEFFLEKNPDWHEKVTLVLIVVPSRIGVWHYQRMKEEIDELVGRINGRFARIGWTPILYQYKSLEFEPMVALYSVSDVTLVTPLRDGMNLIAKEYVACRRDQTGVLILSEMAGAAREMGEAIIINPNTPQEIAAALLKALVMPVEEQKKRNRAMQTRLERYDVRRWADDFLQTLLNLKEHQKRYEARLLSRTAMEDLLHAYENAEKRLILLDYDGTLIPFASRPRLAVPTEEIFEILKSLSRLPSTDVVVISGRDKGSLEKWFGTFDIELVAEHGVWIKEKLEPWKMIKPLPGEWKNQILPILELHSDRLPGSFVEEKDFSIAFHYREADPDLASIRVKELTDNLLHLTVNLDVHVAQGSKVLEISSGGITKGSAALHFFSRKPYSFLLAIGDDWTDEDLFRILPETAYSIKVGLSASHARFNLRDPEAVQKLLMELK